MNESRTQKTEALERHPGFFLKAAVKTKSVFNKLIESSEILTSSLLILLVFVTFFDVVMRYVFNSGSVALQELELHLFSAIFLLGAAVTLRDEKHVRVDLIYRSRFFNERYRAFVDTGGILFFLLPFCALIILTSAPFVYDAYIHNEVSPDPGGLPYRWLIKFSLPLGFFLIMIQGLVSLRKNVLVIIRKS